MEVQRAEINQEEVQMAKNTRQTDEFHCGEGSVSCNHNEIPMAVSGERGQGSVTLRGNFLFTVYLFPLSLFCSILFCKLKGGNTIRLEKENNKAKNNKTRHTPSPCCGIAMGISSWCSWGLTTTQHKLMAGKLVEQVIQAPRPLSFLVEDWFSWKIWFSLAYEKSYWAGWYFTGLK